MDAISAGDGTIGYADASQVGDLGVAALKVGATFQKPDAPRRRPRSSTSRRGSTRPGANVFTYDLKRDTASQGVYPNVLTSYEMACTTYDDANTAALVKGYLNYIISSRASRRRRPRRARRRSARRCGQDPARGRRDRLVTGGPDAGIARLGGVR